MSKIELIADNPLNVCKVLKKEHRKDVSETLFNVWT